MVDVHQTDIDEVNRFFRHWSEQLVGFSGTVYHYTGTAGLKGIIQEGRIRLTNIAYLNDSSEYVRSASRIHIAVEAVTDLEQRPGVRFMFERIRQRLRVAQAHGYLPPPLTFVASFSMRRDDLGQWRAYGGPQAGFALGFDALRLAKVVHGWKGYLARCIYDDDALNSFVRNLLEHIGGVFASKPAFHQGTDAEYADALIDLYQNHLDWIVPIFKEPGFKGENEVRIVVGKGSVSLSDVIIDPKPSVLSGYIEMDLNETDTKLMPLVSVDVGPSGNAPLSTYAAQALLVNKGYPLDIVSRSRIPFRTL